MNHSKLWEVSVDHLVLLVNNEDPRTCPRVAVANGDGDNMAKNVWGCGSPQ